jgi:integrase
MAHKGPRVLFTNRQCLIEGRPYPGIPLLLDNKNQIVQVASDWLRQIVLMRARATSSARQFAYHLKYWWEYLIGSKIPWDEVDDSIMIAWRDHHLRDIEPSTVNGYMSTVFRMYLWAEKHGYVNGLIGEHDLAKRIHPPLSVDIAVDRRGRRKFISPLLKRTVAKPVLPTPTHEDITKVHQALGEMYGDNTDLMVRDALILTWAELSGTRRMEVLAISVAEIPAWDELMMLEESGDKKEITITGKRGKRRSLWVGADLLSQTREYIEDERHKVVKRWRKRYGSNYKVSHDIFLSMKTGRGLDKDTLSQKYALAFRKAGVKGSLHRVRARFITDLVFNALEAAIERLGSIPDAASLLTPVAELAGHSNLETLARYLAVGKKRLLRQTDVERAAVFKERAVVAERRSTTNLIKLHSSAGALRLVKAFSSGNKGRIRTALKELCEDYDVSGLQPLSPSSAHKRKKKLA